MDREASSVADVGDMIEELQVVDEPPAGLEAALKLETDQPAISPRHHPVRPGAGLAPLLAHLVARLPEGPQYFPDDVVRELPDEHWVAELVREQLLAVTRDELPYSIATRVTEWEWPRIRCEIIVERDSQKGMVIGRGGTVLKEVGRRVREQLPPGAFIELFVKIDKDWQRRPDRVERLGY